MPKISEEFSRDIRSGSKRQIIYRDDYLTGFGLRVTASQKAYIAECKVNGECKRITLGRYGAITADEARA